MASAARVLAAGGPGRRRRVPAAARPLRGDAQADASKSLLQDPARPTSPRSTGQEPEPLERLVRVRPRTLVMIATLTGAFYFLLPQLANVDDSIRGAAVGQLGLARRRGRAVRLHVRRRRGGHGRAACRQRLPFVPTVEAQLASSFVNRVTPANVGGMALNVRYLQKAGVPPAEAVTGMGLNVLAGGVVHIVLLVVFFAWAGRSGSAGVLAAEQQQAARRHRRSAGRARRRRRHAEGAARAAQARAGRSSSSRSPASVPLARSPRRVLAAVRRIDGRHARVRRARSPARPTPSTPA